MRQLGKWSGEADFGGNHLGAKEGCDAGIRETAFTALASPASGPPQRRERSRASTWKVVVISK